MFNKNQIIALIVCLFFILRLQLYSENKNLNLDTLYRKIEINYNHFFNFDSLNPYNNINIINKYLNVEKKEEKIDTTKFSFYRKIVCIKTRDYDLLCDDSLVVFINKVTQTIQVKPSYDNKNILNKYFNLEKYRKQNTKNHFFHKDKIVLEINNDEKTVIPKKSNYFTSTLNNLYFIETVEHTFYNFNEKLSINQIFEYKNIELTDNYKNAIDYLFEKNKLKKEYENFKISK